MCFSKSGNLPLSRWSDHVTGLIPSHGLTKSILLSVIQFVQAEMDGQRDARFHMLVWYDQEASDSDVIEGYC